MNKKKYIRAQEIFLEEIETIKSEVINQLNENFDKAIDIIKNTTGKLIVIGMGKSGLVGGKIAATFASTGTPSFFLHPGEALHGDLGMIEENDNILLLSYSGETDEILKIIPSIKKINCKIISITGNTLSTMAINSDAVLSITISKEVCPNNLAPTTSTTAQIMMGDALATVLMETRNFKPIDFAKYHPGGSLGRRLLTKVKDEMYKNKLPLVNINSDIKTLILSMTNSSLGLAIILNDEDKLQGVVTDGDLRRAWNDYNSLQNKHIKDIMNDNPLIVNQDENIGKAEDIMKKNKITSILVSDNDDKIVGILQIY